MGGVQSAVPATKNATHLLKTLQKYCACHTKPPLKRHETCWNVTKCHACHATRQSRSSDMCRSMFLWNALARLADDPCGCMESHKNSIQKAANPPVGSMWMDYCMVPLSANQIFSLFSGRVKPVKAFKETAVSSFNPETLRKLFVNLSPSKLL